MAKSCKQTASSCTGWQVWCWERSEKYLIGETGFISVTARCHTLQVCLHLYHARVTRWLRTLQYPGCYANEASCRKLEFHATRCRFKDFLFQSLQYSESTASGRGQKAYSAEHDIASMRTVTVI